MTKEEVDQIIDQMTAPFDADAITLETDRLLLRPVNPDDLTDIHEIVSDPAVAATAGFSLSESLEESANRMLQYMDEKDTLAVVLKQNGKLIGTVSLQKRNWTMYPIAHDQQGREFGFDLNRAYWGRGLMPEAVAEVLKFGFLKLNLHRITARYMEGNTPSRRVMEKAGMVLTGTEPDGLEVCGKVYDKLNFEYRTE